MLVAHSYLTLIPIIPSISTDPDSEGLGTGDTFLGRISDDEFIVVKTEQGISDCDEEEDTGSLSRSLTGMPVLSPQVPTAAVPIKTDNKDPAQH